MVDYTVKILVVEDEMIIGAKVSMYLTELGYEVAGIFPSAEETLHYLRAYEADIALVDVQLKGSMDGIELAHILQKEYGLMVLFLTANFDDATFERAKEAKPYAFLSKPLNRVDLRRALDLTVSHFNEENKLEKKPSQEQQEEVLKDRIFVHHGDKKVKILFDEILYIQAERNYCRIVTATKDYLLSMPMKSLEEELPGKQFQRIHRSNIVNLNHVEEINDHSVIIGSIRLPMSKSYQQSFMQKIKAI